MPAQYADIVHALGTLVNSSPVGTVSVRDGQIGFSPAATRNSAGEYSVTLAEPIDETQSVILCQLKGAPVGAARVTYTRTDDSTILLHVNIGGSAADGDVDMTVLRTRI